MKCLSTGSLCVLLVLVSAMTLPASEGPLIEIDKRAAWGVGWDVEVLELDPDAAPNAEMIFRIENVTNGYLHEAQFSVTLVREDDAVLAGVQYVVPVDLDPRGVRHVSQILPFPKFQPGDRLIVSPEVLAPQEYQGNVFEKVGPSQCTTYCDRCADKAKELCLNGTSTYSCSCSESQYTCMYTCNPPPK